MFTSHYMAHLGLLSLTNAVWASPIFKPLGGGGSLLGTSFGVPGQNRTFDYVVVGGGMAGLALASRLAEDSSVTIGVVEAGTFYELSNGNNSEIPGLDIQNVGKDKDDWHPGNDWGFITTPQQASELCHSHTKGLFMDVASKKDCANSSCNVKALLGVEAHYPRGKMFGGSSARNYLTYHMGTKGSYDMWADLVGDDSYRYDEFLPYFMRSQNFTPPDSSNRFENATARYDDTVLGTDGKLDVIFPNYANAFGTWVEKGLAAIGMSPIDGFQSGDLIGSSYSLATIEYESNTRASSETEFLRPELQKDSPNAMFYPNTLGKKVLFDDNKKATGVLVETDGFLYQLSATREVILSAGAFQSPQLLMVSGIGPRELLEEHDIDVLVDSPGVGQNMTDHVLFGSTYRVNVVTGSSLAYGNNMDIANQQFKEGTGPLVNPNVDMFGWEKLPRSDAANSSSGALSSNATNVLNDLDWFSPDWPEIEYIAPGGYFGYATNFAKGNPTDGYNYATIVSGMVATLSKGSVSISSSDTSDLPIIDPNWLSHPADQAVAVAAFKRTREIWESDAMAELRIGEEYFPGKEDVSTDEEIWNFVQKSFSTIFHASCTCRMGKAGDPTAVVDARGRVFGVQGLRVVDASSMPLLPPGHPMATIYALAEKIGEDLLSEDNGY